jgi:sphingolipid delta-4 desaturase
VLHRIVSTTRRLHSLLPCVIVLVFVQLATAVAVKDASWPIWLLCAWVLGGTISHSLSLASHELSHGLCFESSWMNEALAIFSNCAQAVPSAITFKRYHLEHHQNQGHDQIDVRRACEWPSACHFQAKRLILIILPCF